MEYVHPIMLLVAAAFGWGLCYGHYSSDIEAMKAKRDHEWRMKELEYRDKQRTDNNQ